MAARNVWVLVISAGMISLDGMLASWIMGFQHAEIRQKSSIKSFTINADAAQTEMTTLASALDVTKGVSNMPKTQIIPNSPGTASVNVMSGSSVVSRASSVAIAELSQPTRAETAAVRTAGAVRSTAAGTIVSSETTEKVTILLGTKKAERQETAETSPGETVTTYEQNKVHANVETLRNTAQKTPEPESISDSDIIQTNERETDVTIFVKPSEKNSILKQGSGTTRFAPTIIATANIRSATPIPEPVTDRATNFITSKLRTSKITPENKATTKTRPDITLRKAAVLTETKVHLTEGQPGPSTIIKTLETSKKHTVRPQNSFQAIKTSNGPSISEASGINLITMIQTATRKQDKGVGKQLGMTGMGVTIKSNVLTTIKSTINYLNYVSPKRQTAKVINKLTTQTHKSVSPCTGKCQTKSTTKNNTGRRGQVKKPLSYDKTFYSAIIMGSILLICGLLALVVFIKDFTGPK